MQRQSTHLYRNSPNLPNMPELSQTWHVISCGDCKLTSSDSSACLHPRQVVLSRYDLFHAHIFASHASGELVCAVLISLLFWFLHYCYPCFSFLKLCASLSPPPDPRQQRVPRRRQTASKQRLPSQAAALRMYAGNMVASVSSWCRAGAAGKIRGKMRGKIHLRTTTTPAPATRALAFFS